MKILNSYMASKKADCLEKKRKKLDTLFWIHNGIQVIIESEDGLKTLFINIKGTKRRWKSALGILLYVVICNEILCSDAGVQE